VHVARYIPQTQLLEHCAVVVSHAGSGTFLAALAAGLPQVCIPQAADQFFNAAACAKAGAGIAVGPDALSVEAVRDAVGTLLDDTTHRDAARRVSREIASMPSPSDVVDKLHAAYD
jgi:UDP:flavonoid glycosyltransferase YjiC (YdhE family)